MRGSRLAAGIAWALGAWCASGIATPEAADAWHRIGVVAPWWLLAWLLAVGLAVATAGSTTRGAAAPLWLPLVSVLPFLPVPLPPAALLAVGPLGRILAASSIVAALTATLAAGRRLVDARARPAAVLAVLASLYCVSAWWIAPRIPGGDEPHYLVITQSLLHDGDLRIEDNHRRHEYAAYVDFALKPDYLRRGRDGAIYSIHAPGVSAIVLPAFMLLGYPGAVLTVALLAALGLGAAWRASYDVSASHAAAAVATLGVGLSVPFFCQAFTIYPDGPAAVAVMVVVWLGLTRSPALTWHGALVCGVLLGMLPWLHTRYAAIAVPLAVVVAVRLVWPRRTGQQWPERARALAAFVVPFVACVVTWLAMFQVIYGTWDPRAPYGHATDMRWARIPHGIAGLLLDQQFGLLPNAPIYAVALMGGVALWRRDRRLILELMIATVPYVVAVAGFHMWWGGHSSPARFLVPALLPLALPLSAWWVEQTGRTARAVTVLLLASSVCLTAAFVLVDHGALVYNSRDGHALWLLAAAAPVNLTYALPSLFQSGPTDAWRVAAGWIASAAIGWAALHRVELRVPATGPWLASVVGGAVLVVAGGTSVGWALSSGSPWDAGSGLVAVAGKACVGDSLAMGTSPMRVGRARQLVTGIPIPDASRRPAGKESLRWAASEMPPGRFRLVVFSGLNASGTASVALGRPDQVLTRCTLADQAPGETPCEIALPAGASALWVTGDGALARTAERFALTLVEPGPPEACDLRAERSVIAPAGTLYLVGGRAWTEDGGLWTAGGGAVRLVVPAQTRQTSLRIRQGGAAGTINIQSGSWTERRQLAPGDVWDVEVPRRPADGVVDVTVTTGGAFRPSDHDPASTDSRMLGAWIEPR